MAFGHEAARYREVMRVRKFNPLLYKKLKNAQGRVYSRALRASSSYTLKKNFFEKFQGETVFIALRKGAYFASGRSLKALRNILFWPKIFGGNILENKVRRKALELVIQI